MAYAYQYFWRLFTCRTLYLHWQVAPDDLLKWIAGGYVVSQHWLPAPLPLRYSHLLLHFLAWDQGEISLHLSVILKLYFLCFRSKTLLKTEVRMQYFYVSGSLSISHQVGNYINSCHLVTNLAVLFLSIVDDVDGGQLRKDIPEINSGKSGQ